MGNLKIWNWHYLIFFDTKILKQVDLFIKELTTKEQEIYSYIREFYLSFYSISQLIDAFEGKPDNWHTFLKIANRNKDKLIVTPTLIIQGIEERIKTLPLECQSAVYELLLVSKKAEYMPNFRHYCQVVFGTLYEEMESAFLDSIIISEIEHGEKISNTDDIISCVKQEIKRNEKDKSIVNKYGENRHTDYDIEISNKEGYAEWWDRDLIEGNKDRLVIHSNSDSMFSNDLRYTLIHEVYPGHSYFYNSLAHNSNSKFDHGAVALIEGWATFAEWNTIPSRYISQIKQNCCEYLEQSFLLKGEERAESIFNKKRELGYSNEESQRVVIYTMQYIGFLESYYLGALWFEIYFSKYRMKPKEFINKIKSRNIGDFFSIWEWVRNKD